jgi:hypothetical protein
VRSWSRVRLEISGPLVPYEVGFTEWLGHKGYVPTVVRVHQRRMIHLSGWMQAAGIGGRRVWSGNRGCVHRDPERAWPVSGLEGWVVGGVAGVSAVDRGAAG